MKVSTLQALVSDGKIFSVQFEKKNGELRDMIARVGTSGKVKGIGAKYCAKAFGLLTVYDMRKYSFRNINTSKIKSVKIRGIEYHEISKNKVSFTITKEWVEKSGNYLDNYNCAIARALKNIGCEGVNVGGTDAIFDGGNYEIIQSRALCEMYHRIDEGKSVEPILIELIKQ